MALEGKPEDNHINKISQLEEKEKEMSKDIEEKVPGTDEHGQSNKEDGLKNEKVVMVEEEKKTGSEEDHLIDSTFGKYSVTEKSCSPREDNNFPSDEKEHQKNKTEEVVILEEKDNLSSSNEIEKSSSFGGEVNFGSNLEEHEKDKKEVVMVLEEKSNLSSSNEIEKSSSFRGEANFGSNLKDYEKDKTEEAVVLEEKGNLSSSNEIEKSSSFRGEANFRSNLKEHEKEKTEEVAVLEEKGNLSSSNEIEKSSSFRGEANFGSNLKEHEKDITEEVVVLEGKGNLSSSNEIEKSSSFRGEANFGSNLKGHEKEKTEEVAVLEEKGNLSSSNEIEKSSSFRGEANFGSNLKEHEKDKKEEVLFVEEKKNEAETEDGSLSNNTVEKNSLFREDSVSLFDLEEYEKKALFDFRLKIEEAIHGNKILKENERVEMEDSLENQRKKEEKLIENEEKKDEKSEKEGVEEKKKLEGIEKDELSVQEEEEEKEKEKQKHDYNGNEEKGEEKPAEVNHEENENPMREAQEKEKITEDDKKENTNLINENKLWGVPLLASKGDKGTDIILLKFLRARDFKVNEAFEMLKNTLQWRKENNIDTILDEDFGDDLDIAAYMSGNDREGLPVCYNVFGVLGDDEMFNLMLGTEEKRDKFLKWRVQLMEKGIQKLDFKPRGRSSLLQINDLKNTPLPSKKELRLAIKQAVAILQDNYPEFVERNIFINVPFWCYAFITILSPFLTQRTKSKFVFARASKATEILLKYVAAEELPVQYGGLKRENDSDFTVEDNAIEAFVKAGSTETIEIPTLEQLGGTLMWDLTVLGWEVNYKEEFVPTDEKSYTIIVKKGRRVGWQEGSLQNSFKVSEPGKVVISIENAAFKRKRILYRYKTKTTSSSS